MLRLFSALPSFANYALAGLITFGTYFIAETMTPPGEPVDTRLYVVGGIVAFLFGLGGFLKMQEEREAEAKPRVSSSDVMQKLTPTETGAANKDLDGVPPENLSGPAADSPLGRVRARSRSQSLEF